MMIELPRRVVPRLRYKDFVSLYSEEFVRHGMDREATSLSWKVDVSPNKARVISENNHQFHVEFSLDFADVSCSCRKFLEEEVSWCKHVSAVRDAFLSDPLGFGSVGHAKRPDRIFYDSNGKTFYVPGRGEVNLDFVVRNPQFHGSSVPLALQEVDSDQLGDVPEVVNPFSHLGVTLYPYQEEAVAHMMRGKRTILSLDMGWGKTLTSLACCKHLLDRDPAARFLVVCPKSLRAQWVDQIRRFIPEVTVQVLKSKREVMDGSTFTVMNFEMTRDYDFPETPFTSLILDEVQRIKSKTSKTWRGCSRIRSRYCWALSGTVVENSVEDFLSVTDVVRPGMFRARWKFYDRFCDTEGRFVVGFKDQKLLDEVLSDLIYRAPTSATPLKNKIRREVRIVKMTDAQLAEHEYWHEKARMLISISMDRPLTLTERALLSAYQTKTRLAANGTRLVVPTSVETPLKVPEALEIVRRADRKVVVFSEWKLMLDLLERDLASSGVRFVRFDGNVDQRHRAAVVKDFVSDPSIKVFCSTDIGGVGLDGLQEVSDTVLHLEMTWNPSKMEQRDGRVHRIGQTRDVTSYVLISSGSIEEDMVNTHLRKYFVKNAVLRDRV